MLWIIFSKKPLVQIDQDITCYWRSSGTWGMYHPNKKAISICPWMIKKAPGNIEGVIKHEIIHLTHPEADMKGTHEEKENYINQLSYKN